MSKEPVFIALFVVLSILVLVTGSKGERLKSLPFGLVAGGAMYFAISLIGISLLGLWRFAPGLNLLGIPLFAVASAIPAAMLFARILDRVRSPFGQVLTVGLAAVAITLLDALGLSMGYLEYRRWSLPSTFGLAGLVLSALAFFLDNPNMVVIDDDGVLD